MEKLDELLTELEDLPDGYISKKTIKGKVYSYLQYFSNGKIVSKYVPNAEVAELEQKLAKRKELEAQVKELKDGYVEMAPLTKREKELTGYIMAGDRVAAKLYKGEVIELDRRFAPYAITRTKDFKSFLSSRCVDSSRANARAILYSLQIKESNDYIIPLYVNACTVTDNYWFKPSGAVTKFEDLTFGKNLYANVAFTGEKRIYPWTSCRTPEITTGGACEKCWKFEEDSWWMYKKENEEEVFCDLFAMSLAQELNIRTVRYIKVENGVKVRNFAAKCNFDTLAGFVDNADDLAGAFEGLKALGNKEVLKDYLKIRYLDALIYNVDRTVNDMGVLRSRKTGDVICMAPNFDNNCCLTSMCPRLDLPAENDPIVKAFCEFLKKNKEARKYFRKAKCAKVKRDMIKRIVLKLNPDKENYKEIINFVIARYTYIKKHKR